MTTLFTWIGRIVNDLYFYMMDRMLVYTDLTVGHLILLVMIISILLYLFKKFVINGK